jgi:hypothetical protein
VAASIEKGLFAQFTNGFFETEDDRLQQLIERNDQFGTSIHFVDSVAEMEKRGLERQELDANQRARTIEELRQEIKKQEEAQAEADQKAKADAEKSAKKGKAQAQIKAATKVTGGAS